MEDTPCLERFQADATGKSTFASKGKSRNVPVDMHEIIDEVITMLDHSIDKNITVTRDSRASSAWTTGDPTLLQNALALRAQNDGLRIDLLVRAQHLGECPLAAVVVRCSFQRDG